MRVEGAEDPVGLRLFGFRGLCRNSARNQDRQYGRARHAISLLSITIGCYHFRLTRLRQHRSTARMSLTGGARNGGQSNPL
jgi:hypothetical protein